MRAVRHPLESALRPEQALLCLRGDPHPFALVGDWAGGGALLGSAPLRVARGDEDPFELLATQPAVEPAGAAVGGGWFGVLGYRLAERLERVGPQPPAPVPAPAFRLAFHDHLVRFDGDRWWFEALWSAPRAAALGERLELWRARLAAPAQAPRPFAAGALRARPPGAAGHRAAVAECVERIAAGELFQANLALRLEADLVGDALDLAALALPRARPRFGALLEGVVSLSPERFLSRVGDRVESDPIKGTAADPEGLRRSAKDAAEHVMIVDLMRNDLGRVCAYGSVEAGEPRLERYGELWHMVTTVSGRLRPGATDADLLRATFPPGSVTGAPKVAAMQAIAALEPTRREAYTGAIGCASPLAGLELSVTIRTLELGGGRVWMGAGGGVVADSDPGSELAEALGKARGPLRAAGLELAGESAARPAARPPRRPARALDHGPRPDPARGLLETLLVERGAVRALDAHLARLAASARELYGVEPPADLRSRILAAAAGHDGRLRVTLRPDGTSSVRAAPLGVAPREPRLRAFLLPGGLGRHKWADRRLADALAGAAGPGAVALLVDGDGAVLEATWANILLREGDALVTPPDDGRLLPGVRRARLLAAGAREEPVDLARLRAADAVLLSSSLREVPARAGTSARRRHARRAPA